MLKNTILFFLFGVGHICQADTTHLNQNPTFSFKETLKKKKDYTLGSIQFYSVLNTSSGKYFPENEPQMTNSARGLIGRWDWILPEDGTYAYVDGVALLGSFNNYYPSGGFFEGGYGWMFNKSNAKAVESTSHVRYQGGMGVGFGIRAMGFDKSTTTSYGGVWPEFAAIVNIGEDITINPKYSLFPMLNNGLWGTRSSSELLVSYRLLGWLGASARLQSETLFFNDEVPAWNGNQFTGKAKFKTLQIGLSFHSTNY
jgi:hypothetical protein